MYTLEASPCGHSAIRLGPAPEAQPEVQGCSVTV